jgi:thiamine pyrophosphokinase
MAFVIFHLVVHLAMDKCALVFTGGKAPKAPFDLSLIPKCDFICAADSGLDTATNLGFDVDTAIGDFDSLKDHSLLEKIEVLQLSKAKDVSDTEALLQLISKKGYSSYILVGGGEGRFDHLLHLYFLFAKYRPPKIWFTASETLYLVEDKKEFKGVLNKTVSIMPALYNGFSKVKSSGLKWELDDFTINGTSQSLSNVIINDILSLIVTKSPVFVAFPFVI